MRFRQGLERQWHNLADLNVDPPVIDHKQSLELRQHQVRAHRIITDQRLKREYLRQVIVVIVHDLD
mgnify:FL=1